MIRVVIDGTAGPYTATGIFINEDERYLVLDDRGVKVNIPVSRILKIEDLKSVMEAPPMKTVEPNAPLPPPVPPEPTRELHPDPLPSAVAAALGAQSRGSIEPKDVKKAILEKVGLGTQKREAAPFNHGTSSKDPIDVNVMVTGAAQKKITIQIPEYIMSTNSYSPNIAKHISLSPEIKSLMEGGIIFDGLPEVNGNNIYIKTKHLKDSVSSLSKNLGLANKINGAMGVFQKPTGNFETDFSMESRRGDGFAIGHSPFEGQVKLDDTEVTDASSEQESTSDQREPEPTMQDMPGEGVSELHEAQPDDRPAS